MGDIHTPMDGGGGSWMSISLRKSAYRFDQNVNLNVVVRQQVSLVPLLLQQDIHTY